MALLSRMAVWSGLPRQWLYRRGRDTVGHDGCIFLEGSSQSRYDDQSHFWTRTSDAVGARIFCQLFPAGDGCGQITPVQLRLRVLAGFAVVGLGNLYAAGASSTVW